MAGQQAAPALAAAVRDLYIAVRALPGTLPGGPGQGAPGAVPGKIRQAADSIGAAWQCMGGEPVPRARSAMTSGPGGVLREAVHRAVTAWSRPAATGQDRDEVIEGAMGAVHGLAAAAGYLAWGSSGLRACRLRNAQGYLEAAGEQLREALACSRAASRVHGDQPHAAGPRDVRDGRGERRIRAPAGGAGTGRQAPAPAPGPPRHARQARSRGKRLAYRIRELLAHRAWPRKWSAYGTDPREFPGHQEVSRQCALMPAARPLDSALHDFPGRHRINASIIRDTITGLAAIAIAAAALVAGCGGQASVPLPAHSTSVHAPTASPSPADTGSARQQVIAAYTAYFPASKAAEAAAPARAQAILAPYAAQPYLRQRAGPDGVLPRPR